MKKIIISAENVSVTAELNESVTAGKIWEVLPIEGEVSTWGDEIYFEIPVEMTLESDARADVEVGEIGYWPTGDSFCIFFGRTPASRSDKPKAATPVNIVGRVKDDATRFRTVKDGAKIRIEKSKS